jgi:hypothetical protein
MATNPYLWLFFSRSIRCFPLSTHPQPLLLALPMVWHFLAVTYVSTYIFFFAGCVMKFQIVAKWNQTKHGKYPLCNQDAMTSLRYHLHLHKKTKHILRNTKIITPRLTHIYLTLEAVDPAGKRPRSFTPHTVVPNIAGSFSVHSSSREDMPM